MAIKYNYEKDFTIEVEIPECVGDNDFRIDFFTKGDKTYSASRIKNEYSTNIRKATSDNKFKIALRKHCLPLGQLKSRGYCWLPDDFSPDGIMQEPIRVIIPDIELWTGNSDEICNK